MISASAWFTASATAGTATPPRLLPRSLSMFCGGLITPDTADAAGLFDAPP
jgi:hypothetical protein